LSSDIKIESNVLELKFQGNGINPNKLTPSEIADLLKSFESCIRSIAISENPEISSFDGSIKYSDIGHRSLSFRYVLEKSQELIKGAFIVLTSAISSENIDNLPKDCLSAVTKFAKFNKQWDCKAYMGYYSPNNKSFNELAQFHEITKRSEFKNFKQNKTVFGDLVKLDVENLRADFRLINGKAVNCKIKRTQIKKLRGFVGEQLKIKGEFSVSGETLEMKRSFILLEFKPEKLLSINETIDFIRSTLN